MHNDNFCFIVIKHKITGTILKEFRLYINNNSLYKLYFEYQTFVFEPVKLEVYVETHQQLSAEDEFILHEIEEEFHIETTRMSKQSLQ
jgi:hypothetical protein